MMFVVIYGDLYPFNNLGFADFYVLPCVSRNISLCQNKMMGDNSLFEKDPLSLTVQCTKGVISSIGVGWGGGLYMVFETGVYESSLLYLLGC